MYASSSRKRKASEQVVPDIDACFLEPRQSNSRPFFLANNPFPSSDYPIPDFQRIYNLMRDSKHGLQLADRRWRFLIYPKCFVGSEAVQWMVDNLMFDRPAAVSTGERLMDAGIIHHVTHSEPFADRYYFYRFQEDDASSILNMKRVWDSAIPARHAVDVARDLLTRLALLCEEHRKRILDGKDISKPICPREHSAVSDTLSSIVRRHSCKEISATVATDTMPSIVPLPITGIVTSPRPTLLNPLPNNFQSPVSQKMTSFFTLPVVPSNIDGDDIDYSALAKSENFRHYCLSAAELQRVHLVALNPDERIAFFVNCYNLLCLHAHVTHGPPNNLIRRWTFFRVLSYRIAGLDMTLDDIEHGILRGNKRPPMLKFIQQLRPSDAKCQQVSTKRDSRIHFVISAGTRSDPPIRILDGENVQEELHEATTEFLSYFVKVDMERRTVTLPRIFLWYAEDFPTPTKTLLTWVAQYLPVESSHHLLALVAQCNVMPTIIHENFDWASAEARFNASVIRRKRRKLERERSSAVLSAFEQDGLEQQMHGTTPFPSENMFRVQDATLNTGCSEIVPSHKEAFGQVHKL